MKSETNESERKEANLLGYGLESVPRYFQFPNIPSEGADEQIGSFYVFTTNPVKSLILILPFWSLLASQSRTIIMWRILFTAESKKRQKHIVEGGSWWDECVSDVSVEI